ncbi:hypothetical protein FOL47_008793, partial [Perkinsus chesapeaki]
MSSSMQPSRGILHPPMYTYSEDFESWAERYQLTMKANGYDDTRGLSILPLYLDQTTYALYKEVSESSLGTLSNALTALKEALKPRTAVTWLDFTQQRLKTGEHPIDFATRLRHMVDNLLPGLSHDKRDELCTHQFLAGIPAEYARSLCSNTKTPTLFEAAQR